MLRYVINCINKFPGFYAFIKYLNGQKALKVRSGDCQVRCPCVLYDFQVNINTIWCIKTATI